MSPVHPNLPADHVPAIVRVPVVKSKSHIDVDANALDGDVYAEVVKQGLKVVVNGGAHKITPANLPDDATRMAEAQKLAEDRVQAMYEGKLAIRAAKAATKAEGRTAAQITEARRIARTMVKASIKEKGQKISGYSASEITKLANELLAAPPEVSDPIFAQAEKNLAVRNDDVSVSIDNVIRLKDDHAVEVAASDKAKKAKPPLSKTQAGITEHRATH